MERSGLETLAAHGEPYCAYMIPGRSLQNAFPDIISSAVRPSRGSKRIVEAAECQTPYSDSKPTPCNVADDLKRLLRYVPLPACLSICKCCGLSSRSADKASKFWGSTDSQALLARG